MEEEEKEEEEEVLEGGECGVFVCFRFKLLLQHRLFFHWLLCGPVGGAQHNVKHTRVHVS